MKNIVLKSPSSETEFAQYFEFRWRHLRKPLSMPKGSERDQQEDNSFHCVAYTAEQGIVGVGRITAIASDVMQIRYMAVAENMRQQGVGSMILRSLVEHAKQHDAQLCWLNARADVLAFYEKNGFQVQQSIKTDLPIPHYRMQLALCESV